jgi:hypothetical protein
MTLSQLTSRLTVGHAAGCTLPSYRLRPALAGESVEPRIVGVAGIRVTPR